MTYNEAQITDIVYDAIHAYIETKISGKVYHKDCRPADSMLEDAEIVFSAANAEQIQEGFVYVNVFVRDINNGGKRKVLNRPRLKELANYMNGIIQPLKNETNGKVTWAMDEAPSFVREEATSEHFVSVKLRFKRYNN